MNDVADLVARAELLNDINRHDEALRTLAPALAHAPDDARVLGELSRTHLLNGKAQEALEAADAVRRHAPDWFYGHYLAAAALRLSRTIRLPWRPHTRRSAGRRTTRGPNGCWPGPPSSCPISKLAAGSGWVSTTVLVTTTVLDEGALATAVAELEQAGGASQLRLRLLYELQAAGFYAGLPAGLHLPELATGWSR